MIDRIPFVKLFECRQIGQVLLSICLLLNSLNAVLAGACPYGWKDYPGSASCYLMTDYQVRYSFDTAVDQCTAHQAALIMIDSQSEMNWLNREVNQLSTPILPPKMAWWVGLEDKGQGLGVTYTNGSAANLKLFPWSDGAIPAASTSRRCASFVNNTVSLTDCSSWLGMVCERSKALPLLCDVENGWTFINGSCFKYFSSPQSWLQAKSSCEGLDAGLAKVVTTEESNFIWTQSKLSVTWIGLKSDINTRTYLWLDGTPLDTSLTWWNTNQPLDLSYLTYTDPEICGLISGNGTRRLSSWMTEDCNERHPFTCSKPQGVCADGWISHQGYCIKFYPRYPLPWSAARQYCQNLGGDLLVIPNQAYQDVVNMYLTELKDAEIDSIWLGLQGLANGSFVWVDKSFYFNWTNWALGPTPGTQGNPGAAFISTDDKAGKWQLTSDLSTRRPFACFISGSKVVKDVQPPIPSYQCPTGWEVAGDSCLFFSDEETTWSQANVTCQGQQSQLVVVNSGDILSYLNSRITTDTFWIGLTDRAKEGTFVWVNGTALNFKNWAGGQPDNNGDENCVIAQPANADGATWFDISCQGRYRYICQKHPLNNPGTSLAPPTWITEKYSYKCGLMWEERPGTNFCYQFRDTQLTWLDALDVCNSFNGSLVSIVSRDEQSYIEGRLASLDSLDFWIGASDRRREAGWQWEDGSPFAFLNWHPGEPNDLVQEDCAAINTHTMMWYDYPCNLRTGFVCKKAVDTGMTTTTQVMTVPTALPGQYYGCPMSWLGYEMNCYLMKRTPATWLEAQSGCTQEGGTLASINSDQENKFVWSQLPKESCQNAHANDTQCQSWADAGQCQSNPSWMSLNCQLSCSLCTQTCSDKHTSYECKYWADVGECTKNPDWMWSNCAFSCGCDKSINEGYWLGLNDRQVQMTFMWDDLSPVTFTNWLTNEPNNYEGKMEDCVKMSTVDGEWSDELCDQKSTGYVCKKKMAVMNIPTISPDKIGCPILGFAYGATCFVIVDLPKTWQDAKSYCSMQNATLANIPDSVTGAFITSELIQKTSSYWIGLSNVDGTYKWGNGMKVDYLAWAPSHTGSEKNTCVAMRSQKPIGLWEDIACQSSQPFICETYRRGYTQSITTSPAITTTSAPCPNLWTGHDIHCYRLFTATRNWPDAQAQCQTFGGSLASAHDDSTAAFFSSLAGYSVNGGFWIGLTDRDKESSYAWSDESPFDYSSWAQGEPNSATEAEDCVEQSVFGRHWNDLNCYVTRAYVCSIIKGIPLPSVLPTITTTQAPKCQDANFISHGGFCYYISPSSGKNSSLNWFQSRRMCQSMSGDLVSINSADENNFLVTLLSQRSIKLFWTGFNQLEQEAYTWSDGSPQVFMAWGKNEPNSFMGGERCVSIYGGNWQDDECMDTYGYVCKKRNDTSSTLAPTTSTPPVSGVCPNGFVNGGVNNKCYYIGGRGNSSSDDPKRSWEDARDFCRNITSPKLVDIGSIHDLGDQDFVTSLIWDLSSNMWIGLNDRVKSGQFFWMDNSEVIYTNWAWSQPSQSNAWTLNQDNCVEMYRDPHRGQDIAKWNDAPCNKLNAFLCQTSQSPLPTLQPTTTPGTTKGSGCPENFFKFKSTCYSVFNQPLSWSEARKSCQSFNGDLASTLDIFEVSRLDLALLSNRVTSQAWIGLKYDKVSSSQYQWSDGWPLDNTFWSDGDPNLKTNDTCVAFSKARWNDTSCSEVLPYICEIKSEAPPSPTPVSLGYCADPTHESYGDFCYLVKANEYKSWPEASFKCANMGMQLASIHSEAENRFVNNYADHVLGLDANYGLERYNIWLGLQKNLEGGFTWSDGSSASFFNWNEGEPSSATKGTSGESCVEMYRDSGFWNDLACTGQSLGYVCKVSKVFSSTLQPTIGPPSTTPVTIQWPTDRIKTSKVSSSTGHTTAGAGYTSGGTGQTQPQSLTPDRNTRVAADDDTLSGGQVAAIVISILIFFIIVIAVVYVIKKGHTPCGHARFADVPNATGYDNALYVREQNEESGEKSGKVKLNSSNELNLNDESGVTVSVSES